MKRWLLATRPATLAAAFVPVAVGTACAYAEGGARWDAAACALLGAIFIQIGTNFANDVFDAEKGADTEARLGPTRAVASGLISARAMRIAMVIAFGLSVIPGLYLASLVGWPVIVIGVASIAAGIGYTGGPYPLGYHGLGDVFVMLFFGFVAVCGTAFVQLGSVPDSALLASIPPGALSTAILAVNNLRDRETDVLAGKRTVAVRFGARAAMVEYLALLTAAYLAPVLLFVLGFASAWVLAPLATLPLALLRADRVVTRRGRALNEELVGTAKLTMLHGALFTLGIAMSNLGVRIEDFSP